MLFNLGLMIIVILYIIYSIIDVRKHKRQAREYLESSKKYFEESYENFKRQFK